MFPSEALNLYTDSKNVFQILGPLETATCVAPASHVQEHLLKIHSLLGQRSHPVFIGHVCSHSLLPGLLSQGNDMADKYMKPDQVCLATASAFEAAI